MKFNYHTHTYRCKHAVGEDREYVETAIEAGIKILGFSDHMPYIYSDPQFTSTCRMDMSQLEEYVTSILNLKEEYKKDIEIHLGFEAEYAPMQFDKTMDRILEYPVEYLILGQHFLDEEVKGEYVGRPCGEDYLKRYAQQSMEALDTGKFLYMAHPDVINFTGSDKVFEHYMRPVLELLKKKNIPAEFNILGYMTRRHYPSDRYLKLAQKVGNKIIIGYDAHNPDVFIKEEIIKLAEAKIKAYGLEVLETPLSLKKI